MVTEWDGKKTKKICADEELEPVPMKSNSEPNINGSTVALRMMKLMGYSGSGGLGARGQGIEQPVE